MTEPELRDKEHLILQQIQRGNNDVQKITSQTTLENHHVTYAFQKLENLQLVEVSKPDGRVERIIDGQKRVFQHPKQAELTQQGEQYLEHTEPQKIDEYENLTHRELVKRVNTLEKEIEDLTKSFQVFKNQVKKRF
jgi:predicted transcriptional regulator